MAITSLNPTVNTTPDQGGTLAVSGISNTGHTSTLTTANASDFQSEPPQTVDQQKSARWSGFGAGPGSPISVKLKFSWTAVGEISCFQTVAGTGSASIEFVIDYSVNGGSNWTNFISKSKAVGINQSDSLNESGSEIIELSLSQNVTLVQVRDKMTAHAVANAPNTPGAEVDSAADITTTISGIVVEVETASAAPTGKRIVAIW